MPPQRLDAQIYLDMAVTTITAVTLIVVALSAGNLLKVLLSQLLALVETLGIITHMFLIKLAIPANVQDFFTQIFPLVTLDMLNLGAWSDIIFKFSDRDLNRGLNS